MAVSLYLVTSLEVGFGFQLTSTPRPSGTAPVMKGTDGGAVEARRVAWALEAGELEEGAEPAVAADVAVFGAAAPASGAATREPTVTPTTTAAIAAVLIFRQLLRMPAPPPDWMPGR